MPVSENLMARRPLSYWTLLLFPALLLTLMLTCSPARAVVLDRVVAVVNNEVITWLELYETMELELAPKLKGLEGDARRLALSAEESDFLESMVLQRIQLQEARKQGVFISNSDIDSTIENIRAKYGLSEEAFKQAVEGAGTDWDHYRRNMKKQLMISKLVDKEVRSGLMAPAEVEGAAAPETSYHLKQIFISADRAEDEMRSLVEAVYEALQNGEEFEAVAVRMSEGPGAASGGDLGTLEASALSDAMRESVAGLRTGEVGPPVRSSRGIHILKLHARISSSGTAGAGGSGGAGKSLEQRTEEKYDEWLRDLRDRSQVDIRL